MWDGSRPQGGRGTGRGAAGTLVVSEECMTQQRIVAVVSHVAELGLFFAAAAALGAGLLGLK